MSKQNIIDGIKNGTMCLVVRSDDEYKRLCALFDEDLLYKDGRKLSEQKFDFGGFYTGLRGVGQDPYNICILTNADGSLGFSYVKCGIGKRALKNRIKKFIKRDTNVIEIAEIEELLKGE